MQKLFREVDQYLRTQGRLLLGLPDLPLRIRLQSVGPAVVAHIDCLDRSSRAVIKPIQPSAIASNPALLLEVNRRLRGFSASFSQSFPALLGTAADGRWIVMEYVTGPTLEQLQRRALAVPRRDDADVVRTLGNAAAILASLHQIRPQLVGLTAHQTDQGDGYRIALEECFGDPTVRACLPRRGDGFLRLQQKLASYRHHSEHDRVLLVDCQPKNILVPSPDQPRFIDQDYSVSHPAMTLAHFLVSMDRLGLRYPMPRQIARIAAWKQVFIEAYAATADRWIIDDLAYFYPWTLMRILVRHARQHRFLGPYLRHTYGRSLRAFLTRVEADHVTASRLFAAA